MAGLKKFKPEEDFIRRLKYLAHHATNLAVTAGYFMKTWLFYNNMEGKLDFKKHETESLKQA